MSTTSAVEDVESQLARDRRLHGASFHRMVGGRKVRVPPNNVVISADGQYLLDGKPCEIVEQIATAQEISDG